MNLSRAPKTMGYALSQADARQGNRDSLSSLKKLLPYMRHEKRNIVFALLFMLIASASALSGPLIIAHSVDEYIAQGDIDGITRWAAVLLVIYLCGFLASYMQARRMGEVGRRMLFNIRNEVFQKLQELPVAFFVQNRSGDLISRINSDTERLFQFIVQAFAQFVNSGVLIFGAGLLLLTLRPMLGMAALGPAVGVLVITQLITGWVKRRNFDGLRAQGNLSSEVQESLANFKVIVAFNRADYFRRKFSAANESNFHALVRAGVASNIISPVYGLAYNLAQLIVLTIGISLISQGAMTTGLLIGYLLYVNNFYQPLLQLAAAWSSFQLALAALDRIGAVLALESDLITLPVEQTSSKGVVEFRRVSFGYTPGKEVLRHVHFTLERGKTYALVGPTGGGKTTTAYLMARLYDPVEGHVLLNGRDIRSYSAADRASLIGFILQEPCLFTGSVGENIAYGHPAYRHYSREKLEKALADLSLSTLLARFPAGLDTKVTWNEEAISLGQKQLIAFMRAALRRPELLILDEATANIDTVAAQLLEWILAQLPGKTTKVVIAHRLETIRNADEIFFVGAGDVVRAGSMRHAMEMLLDQHMVS